MDYLEPEVSAQLLERLLRGTQRGTLQWAQIGDNEYSFILRGPKFAYLVASRDLDDFAPFVLTLFDISQEKPKQLQEIETSTDATLTNNILAGLYDQVKRTVLRLDSVAEDVFADLDSLEARDERP